VLLTQGILGTRAQGTASPHPRTRVSVYPVVQRVVGVQGIPRVV